MNSFLRRVEEQRLLEQEAEILARPPGGASRCRKCGKGCTGQGGLGDDNLCGRCNNANNRDRNLRDIHASLPLPPAPDIVLTDLVTAPIGPAPIPKEHPMAKECRKCGKTLRSTNQKGICAPKCKNPPVTAAAAEEESTPAPARKAVRAPKPARSDVERRFFLLAEGLGQDPNTILEDFMGDWLDKVSAAAELALKPPRKADADEDLEAA